MGAGRGHEPALKQAGVPSELVRLDGAPHGMGSWEGRPEWARYKAARGRLAARAVRRPAATALTAGGPERRRFAHMYLPEPAVGRRGIESPMDLSNRVAIITGGKRIGRIVARELARRGVDLVLSYRGSKEEAMQTVADVEALGRRGDDGVRRRGAAR